MLISELPMENMSMSNLKVWVPTYPNEFSDKQKAILEEARTALMNQPPMSKSSVAMSAFVSDEGYSIPKHEACHYHLIYKDGYNKVGREFAVITRVMPNRVDDKIAVPYFQYLLNESPYQYAFITKNPEEAIHNGIVMNVLTPFEYFISAAFAVRYVSEYKDQSITWLEYVNRGMNKDLAHLLASQTSIRKDSVVERLISGHNCHTKYHLNDDYIYNFLNHIIWDTSSYVSGVKNYSINCIWKNNPPEYESAASKGDLIRYIKEALESSKISSNIYAENNPFKKSLPIFMKDVGIVGNVDKFIHEINIRFEKEKSNVA